MATTYLQLLGTDKIAPTHTNSLRKRAHTLYDEALDIFRRHQRQIEVARAANHHANLLASEFEAGDASAAPRAHELYDEALDIRRCQQRSIEVAQTATEKATLLAREFEAGDSTAASRAHALFDEALDTFRRCRLLLEVAQAASEQATLLQIEFEAGDTGAAPRAHALYNEALEIFRNYKTQPETAQQLKMAQIAQNQAILLAKEVNAGAADAAPRAHALFGKALEINRRHQRWVEVAAIAQNQALLLTRAFETGEAGAAPRAHALFDEALKISRRHQRWVEVARIATNKATLLQIEFKAGDATAAPRAHVLYAEALDIFRQYQRRVGIAQTITNQANLLAIEFVTGIADAGIRALALYDEAERLFSFDMETLQNLTIRRSHLDLLVAMDDWQKVIALVVSMQADVRRRLPALGTTADRHHLLETLLGAASWGCMAALALGEVDQAVAFLENGRSINLGTRLREAEAPLSLTQRADLDAARRNLYAARTTYQAVLSADPDQYPGGAFDARVKAAKRELDACNAAFETLRSTLDLNLETPPPLPEDLLQALGPDSVVVQFWIGPRGGGALILGPKADGWRHLPLPSLTEDGLNLLKDWLAAYQRFHEDMENLSFVDSFAQAVTHFSPAIMRGCQDLWSLAMGPLHAALAAQGLLPANGAQRAPEVVICPPGHFSILPLHAAINPATGQAFLDDYAVRYAPSLAAVLTATDRAAGRALFDRALVAVTNPQDDLRVEHNPALPFFAPSQRIDLRGYRHVPEAPDVATADRLIAEAQDRNPSCISFYGHGGWDISEAENSAIFLASPLDTAGKVPLDDVGRTQGVPFPTTAIRDLPLANCRLFILAGCETGMIDLNRAPDEFIGLPAAVLEGGAAGALASLWPVSTLDTYTLVQRTLEDIHQTNASPAQALRRAQLRLRDDPDVYVGVGQGMGPAAPGGPGQDDPTDRGRSPYTWAAFSLFGA
ncbi:CHAT domain-containing protein [Rhodospirillum sp. A1_3_36]|uniref:CHAT domain-containing protein n=1 Tax=Rhodospirillum sp. A1_3_36 TaxID=3391666 RepID=UPI0039A5E277